MGRIETSRGRRLLPNSFGMCRYPPSCRAGARNSFRLCRYKNASHLHIPQPLKVSHFLHAAAFRGLTPVVCADTKRWGEGGTQAQRPSELRQRKRAPLLRSAARQSCCLFMGTPNRYKRMAHIHMMGIARSSDADQREAALPVSLFESAVTRKPAATPANSTRSETKDLKCL